MTDPTKDELPESISNLISSIHTVPGYWQQNILWSVLASSEQTGGDYSLIEQLMPSKSGPPPHVHDHGSEVFYILEGEMALQLRGHVLSGKAGQLVRIPPGTPHAFAVVSETARVLNFYVPAALDLQISMLSTPATGPTLPPPGTPQVPTPEQTRKFLERIHDLATQSWASEADLLAHLRGGAPPTSPK